MRPPIEDYKFLQRVDGVESTAYFTLFEKYMKYNLRGEEKKIEIEDTDQESIIATKNGGFPIPGIIYTFLYKGENFYIQNLPKNPTEYKDLVPLVFCISLEKDHFSGINMNLLPPSIRLQFIQSFYESFQDFLGRESEVLAQNDKLAMNKRFLAYVKSGKGQEMIRLFSLKNGANFNFGYRKYSISKVAQLRMVEYPEWKYIPFYEPKDAFRKLNLNEIYKLYGKSR
jgi:hypothetical protein